MSKMKTRLEGPPNMFQFLFSTWLVPILEVLQVAIQEKYGWQ